MTLLPLMLVIATLGPTQAWLRGNDGRAQWDYECHFEGHDLEALEGEPSSRCAELCLAKAGCSHWTWTSEDDGACQLKQGATNAVELHASHLCGFLPTRFAPDEARAFDLGLTLDDGDEDDRITEEEAGTALRMLNSFRSKRGKTKLTLDARLIVMADELAATCQHTPLTTSMKSGEGYQKFPALPASVKSRGFTGDVHAVSVAAPADSSVRHAIEWWTSAIEPKTGTKVFFSDDVGVVGIAKRKSTPCNGGSSDSGDTSYANAIVWTLLLAQAK
ncbi:unnamed protein product [Phytophthora lilii]|uniref:Unnamed protein product n=1 Tax=Phytophthora lilii TaxID=2077276 RepID=A0A9W6TD63_9STRA|nr:unnamed protein product [Phytophthora lilii]